MNIYTGDVCDTSELVASRTAPASTALVQHDSRLEGSGVEAVCTRVGWHVSASK